MTTVCRAVVDRAYERSDHAVYWQTVVGGPPEYHDHLHDRGSQPRRGQQSHLAEGGKLAGVRVAVAAAPSLGRPRAGLLRQHLRHTAAYHHATHLQVILHRERLNSLST